MVDELMSDEERGEALRQWLAANWMLLLGGIVIGLGILFGGQGWRAWREGKLMEASDLYDRVLQAVGREDVDAVASLTDELARDYAFSPYDTQARLALARLQVEAGDLAAARSSLAEAQASAEDAEVAAVARTREVRVLLAMGEPAEALEVLGAHTPLPAFAALHHELRGDALEALGRTAEARTAYADALTSLGPNRDGRAVQLKLDALPSAASDVPAATDAPDAES